LWHDDVTAGKRAQAVALGATDVPLREWPGIWRARSRRRDAARAPAAPAGHTEREQGCGYPGCDATQTPPYMAGPRCDDHRPRSQFVPTRELPPSAEPARCAGCGTAQLAHGQARCQACGAAEGYRPAAAEYADLSHGSPGHMCVLCRQAGREAEAGS
jgi:hypothetical protein